MEGIVKMANTVESFIEKAAIAVASSFSEKISTDIQCFIKIESPIEQMFYAAIMSVILLNEETHIEVIPQYEIGPYRVDFLINDPDKNGKQIIVELDSQEFHERDEGERRYEKERDRYLQKKGYLVFHYTGKEILGKPLKVATEVLETIMDCEQKAHYVFLEEEE